PSSVFFLFFFFSSRRRHTRWPRDWSSDVCSSDLAQNAAIPIFHELLQHGFAGNDVIAGQLNLLRPQQQHGRSIKKKSCPMIRTEIGRVSCRERVYIWEVGGS